jgi:alpha-tubulin suppressor-like RCC1 family protein
MEPFFRRCAAALAWVALSAGGCADSVVEVEPELTLTVISGDTQGGSRGEELASAVTVGLRDETGAPASGVEVRWRVLSGGGRVQDRVVTTDGAGHAATRWTLGMDRGEQLLLATVGNEGVTLRATSFFRWVAVSAGFGHTCALSNLGEAYCWGANHKGQLGDATETRSDEPVAVVGGLRFREIVPGWSHTCGVARSGELFCWGDNSEAQLGIEGLRSTQSPARVDIEAEIRALSASFLHSCAVIVDGQVLCWGSNAQGQLGRSEASVRPAQVTGPGRYSAVSAGEFHTCALTTDSEIECWGWNSIGELGTGDPSGVTADRPRRIASERTFGAVAAGVRHTCALDADGRAWCWGRSAAGEIGRDPSDHTATPDSVRSSLSFDGIGTGNAHTCALAQGSAYCFGSLPGDGTSAGSVTPVRVPGTLMFESLSVGFEHVCGLADGEIWCWGSNALGQLGVEGVTASDEPVRVPAPRN